MNIPSYNVIIEECKFAQDKPVLGIFLCFSHKIKWGDYMILEECTLENTKIKFYDDYIVENTATQKEYIDKIIINLINKTLLL